MNTLCELIKNPFLLTALFSWCIAQVCKFLIHGFIHKKFEIMRLFGDGGMPSGHSATVSSMAVLTLLRYGAGSFEFALSGILAIIVCRDATGVRLETGKQAVILNELQRMFGKMPDTRLKEFVGHTPVQVGAGILIGIANALAAYYWYLPLIAA